MQAFFNLPGPPYLEIHFSSRLTAHFYLSLSPLLVETVATLPTVLSFVSVETPGAVPAPGSLPLLRVRRAYGRLNTRALRLLLL